MVAPFKLPSAMINLASGLLAVAIGKFLPENTVDTAYLSERNYGAPAPGFSNAAEYFFHEPANALTVADARFLVSYQTLAGRPFVASAAQAQPAFVDSDTSEYRYDELNTPGYPRALAPDLYIPGWPFHDGTVNSAGAVVAAAAVYHAVQAFCWHKDRFIRLPGLPDSGGAFATANNNVGGVVGYCGTEAVMWDLQHHIHDLGTLPGLPFGVARAINDHGQVVGFSFTGSSVDAVGRWQLTQPARAFLWDTANGMRDLGVPPGCVSSRAFAINNAGEVAGWALTSNLKTHAMVWQNGVMQDIGTLGGETSVATAINAEGQVVGSSQRPDGTIAAFLWQNGVMHDLGQLPGDTIARASGINDKGQIVGKSYIAPDINSAGGRAFIWDCAHGMRALVPVPPFNSAHLPATFKTISNAPTTLYPSTTAYSINNRGQIFGLYYHGMTPTGEDRKMFLLTPE
jgi:probable HAF family extracellular repeat protein